MKDSAKKQSRTFGSINSVLELTKRNVLLFLKNKATVFFSLLAPVLILIIYVLFMGDMLVDTVRGIVPEGVAISDKQIKGVVNSWMVSGVVGIACLTVALNSMLTVISDKETKAINDFIASPINPVKLLLSYFLAAGILTFGICLIVLFTVMIFLTAVTGVPFTFFEILSLLLILLLSCLSAVILMMCIMSLFKTNAASAAFSGVFSALIGFLTGAYLPASIMPKGIQSFANLIPGSHSTGLFRSVFLNKAIKNLPDDIPQSFIDEIKGAYSFDLNVFGATLNATHMYLYLAGSIVLFFGIYLLMDRIRKRK